MSTLVIVLLLASVGTQFVAIILMGRRIDAQREMMDWTWKTLRHTGDIARMAHARISLAEGNPKPREALIEEFRTRGDI